MVEVEDNFSQAIHQVNLTEELMQNLTKFFNYAPRDISPKVKQLWTNQDRVTPELILSQSPGPYNKLDVDLIWVKQMPTKIWYEKGTYTG